MSNLGGQGRPRPPLGADETSTLLGFLEYQRATLEWKSAGLDTVGLGSTVGASSITLGGMLKHLARVGDLSCSRWLFGRDPEAAWDTADWDWHSAAEDTPEQIHALLAAAVARFLVSEALADSGPGRLERPVEGALTRQLQRYADSLRWILFHLLEEYARHVGHADLLRESLDALTGE